MKIKVYSIRDRLVGYGYPVCLKNDEVAKRYFRQLQRDDKFVNSSPADYELYRVGEFDTDKGIFDPEDVPVCVMVGDVE